MVYFFWYPNNLLPYTSSPSPGRLFPKPGIFTVQKVIYSTKMVAYACNCFKNNTLGETFGEREKIVTKPDTNR